MPDYSVGVTATVQFLVDVQASGVVGAVVKARRKAHRILKRPDWTTTEMEIRPADIQVAKPMPESEFLLTKEEWEAIIAALPEGDTCGQCREAINKAQLKKVALYLRDNYYAPDWAVYFSPVTWAALLREAGLEDKEVCPQSDCEYQGKCEGDPQKGDYCPLPREAT